MKYTTFKLSKLSHHLLLFKDFIISESNTGWPGSIYSTSIHASNYSMYVFLSDTLSYFWQRIFQGLAPVLSVVISFWAQFLLLRWFSFSKLTNAVDWPQEPFSKWAAAAADVNTRINVQPFLIRLMSWLRGTIPWLQLCLWIDWNEIFWTQFCETQVGGFLAIWSDLTAGLPKIWIWLKSFFWWDLTARRTNCGQIGFFYIKLICISLALED